WINAREISGEMCDRAKIWLIRIQSCGSLATITYKAVILVNSSHSYDPWMTIGTPNTPTRTIVRTTSTIWTACPTVSCRKQDNYTLIDSFDHLSSKRMARVSCINSIPTLLKYTPA